MKNLRVVVIVHLNLKKKARMRTKKKINQNSQQTPAITTDLLQTAINSAKITGSELDPVSDGDLDIDSNTATEPTLEDLKALWN